MSASSLQAFLQVLIRQRAFIAHCAGFAKGIGNAETSELSYLDRLTYALENPVELSCSTIQPGDVHTWDGMNYTGKVGLVLKPNTASSITFASPSDVGSQMDPTVPGRRYTGLPPATPQLLAEAILYRRPGTYNELGLIKYEVLGVFIDPPIEYSSGDQVLSISPEEVSSHFDGLRLLCLRRGQLYECIRGAASLTCDAPVPIANLYS